MPKIRPKAIKAVTVAEKPSTITYNYLAFHYNFPRFIRVFFRSFFPSNEFRCIA